jgi:hypothetical protein
MSRNERMAKPVYLARVSIDLMVTDDCFVGNLVVTLEHSAHGTSERLQHRHCQVIDGGAHSR